jgi:hypothetical protein
VKRSGPRGCSAPRHLSASAPREVLTCSARVRALAAYKDFLVLWKDVDPDIPILKEAKAEYPKLR